MANDGGKLFITRRTISLDEALAQHGLMAAFQVEIWEGEGAPSPATLLEKAQGCVGILTQVVDPIDAAFMDAVPTLRVISQCAVGVNNIDLAAARERGIAVGHTPGVLTDATADMTFALLLAAARHVVAGADLVRAGGWRGWEPMLLLGKALQGATLGILGYGRIGQTVARRAKGFDMRVLAHRLSPERAAQDGVTAVDFEALLRESDFLSLHVPLRPETHHLIDAAALALMKRDAALINMARGEVVDPQALYKALHTGQIGMAALDVTEPEPIPADHPLVGLPNCLIVPHLGSATVQARRAMTQLAVANLAAGVRGEPLPHRAN
ncbi:MAG: D-glycerate dehydrogenase [Chloroflexi bacterium CFX4]|nr:D-glycerate dehydrogenase [Chloroflexi bacterium CFX4]MDL1924440.1 D-glycerate dehydrogenase [Chloroflexi bacterium CFX3]